MICPDWYTAVLECDSQAPSRSNEEYIQAILGAIETVIESAIARGQSLKEVRAALLNDDQILSENHRTQLSHIMDLAWAASPAHRSVSTISPLVARDVTLPQSA